MSRMKSRRLGQKLAKNEDDKNEVKETYSPGEPDPVLQILRVAEAQLTGTLTITKKTIDPDIIILGHPVQSKLDGSYKLSDTKYTGTTTLETQNF